MYAGALNAFGLNESVKFLIANDLVGVSQGDVDGPRCCLAWAACCEGAAPSECAASTLDVDPKRVRRKADTQQPAVFECGRRGGQVGEATGQDKPFGMKIFEMGKRIGG